MLRVASPLPFNSNRGWKCGRSPNFEPCGVLHRKSVRSFATGLCAKRPRRAIPTVARIDKEGMAELTDEPMFIVDQDEARAAFRSAEQNFEGTLGPSSPEAYRAHQFAGMDSQPK